MLICTRWHMPVIAALQGHSQLLSKLEASLGYMKPLLRREEGEERERGETVGSCLWGLVLGTLNMEVEKRMPLHSSLLQFSTVGKYNFHNFLR